MKIKGFYENMRDILNEKVTIMDGIVPVYTDFMRDKKVYEYLFESEIKNIYIGKDYSLVVEI